MHERADSHWRQRSGELRQWLKNRPWRPRRACRVAHLRTRMTRMYDAIVVGARCAGASTAMLLARKGYRVLSGGPGDIPERHRARALHPSRRPAPPIATGGSWIACWPPGARRCRHGPTHCGRFPASTGKDLASTAWPWVTVPAGRCSIPSWSRRRPRLGPSSDEGFLVDGLRQRGRLASPASAAGYPRRRAGDGACPHHHRRRRPPLAAGTRPCRRLVYETVPTLTCWYFSYWSGVPSQMGWRFTPAASG